jgi:hypothetical protein
MASTTFIDVKLYAGDTIYRFELIVNNANNMKKLVDEAVNSYVPEFNGKLQWKGLIQN